LIDALWIDASKRGGTKARVDAAAGVERGSEEGAWDVSKSMRDRLRELREDRGARSAAEVMVKRGRGGCGGWWGHSTLLATLLLKVSYRVVVSVILDSWKRDKSETMSDQEQLKDIATPHDHDVLSGRGNFVNHHAGNENFRAL
jgi:hypothetical protein